MRHLASRSLPALMLTALVLAVAGCGGGEVAAGEVPGNPPALTVRSDNELGAAANADANSADSASADATATPEPDATVAPSGTAEPQATAAPDDAATGPEDAAAGQEQPPAGSAPEQFETFCEQNAGAC
jgi:hypothetical protein